MHLDAFMAFIFLKQLFSDQLFPFIVFNSLQSVD